MCCWYCNAGLMRDADAELEDGETSETGDTWREKYLRLDGQLKAISEQKVGTRQLSVYILPYAPE